VIHCTTCITEYADGSLGCLCCGLLLEKSSAVNTRSSVYPTPSTEVGGHIVHVGKLPEQGVAIYVAESQEPLIVKLNDRLTLGRRKDVPVPDLVDLTPFDAYRLGVSRNHAGLVYKDSKIYLHDIGSVNGSWLNGQRLKPYELYLLPSGAAVSLGQLTIYIYY
jgi:hypothetical protein